MQYLIAFQLLCGCFSAFVAGRKGRNRLAWWVVGALVPVFGVLLSLMVPEATGIPVVRPGRKRRERHPRKPPARPKRCRDSYVPDCQGCPYFRRPLFDAERTAGKKGTCTFFGNDLVEQPAQDESHVVSDRS
jgi:hypothetical protein